MKRVDVAGFFKATVSASCVVALALFVSGCAVVGPALSIGGLAGLAPLQYISTAYTIGEFTYEYAANDNTPDMVIENKYQSVMTGEAFELPDYLSDEAAGPEAPTMVAGVDDTPADPVLYEEARRKRIENLLGRRQMQFERLEIRRMAFLQAKEKNTLSLRQTAMASSPDLYGGAVDEVSLD